MPNNLYAVLIVIASAVVAVFMMLGFILVLPFLLAAAVIFFYFLRRRLARMQSEAGASPFIFTMTRSRPNSGAGREERAIIVVDETGREYRQADHNDGGPVITVEPTRVSDSGAKEQGEGKPRLPQ